MTTIAAARGSPGPAWALLFGLAFLLKPPLGGGALVCAAYLAQRERRRTGRRLSALWPVLVAGLGSLVPIAAMLLWFKLRGAWPALDWTFFDFTPGYTRLGWHGQGAPESSTTGWSRRSSASRRWGPSA